MRESVSQRRCRIGDGRGARPATVTKTNHSTWQPDGVLLGVW